MGFTEKTQDKTIDGFTYRVIPLSLSVGQKYLIRFLKLAAPVLSGMASGGTMMEAGANAINKVATLLEEKDLTDFQKVFGEQTEFCEEGSEGSDAWRQLGANVRDEHFAARYMQMLDWLRFAMEVNFSGFFEESMRRAKELQKEADAPKKKTTPTP